MLHQGLWHSCVGVQGGCMERKEHRCSGIVSDVSDESPSNSCVLTSIAGPTYIYARQGCCQVRRSRHLLIHSASEPDTVTEKLYLDNVRFATAMGALAPKRQGHNPVQRCGVVHLFAHFRLTTGIEIMNFTRVVFPRISWLYFESRWYVSHPLGEAATTCIIESRDRQTCTLSSEL